MRIIAKKRYVLRSGGESFTTTPLLIQDVPDKFGKCKLFGLALGAGSIQILATPEKLKAAENEPIKLPEDESGKPPKQPKTPKGSSPVKEETEQASPGKE